MSTSFLLAGVDLYPNRQYVRSLDLPSGSSVNAEIYFDRQLQDFYLSNLRASNPPFIDRQKAI